MKAASTALIIEREQYQMLKFTFDYQAYLSLTFAYEILDFFIVITWTGQVYRTFKNCHYVQYSFVPDHKNLTWMCDSFKVLSVILATCIMVTGKVLMQNL